MRSFATSRSERTCTDSSWCRTLPRRTRSPSSTGRCSCTRDETGEFSFRCTKTDQYDEGGQLLGEEVFTNTFRCKGCSHGWNDGQKTRLVREGIVFPALFTLLPLPAFLLRLKRG